MQYFIFPNYAAALLDAATDQSGRPGLYKKIFPYGFIGELRGLLKLALPIVSLFKL